MKFTVNVPGNDWNSQVYELLLIDRTTQQNIVWATDDYLDLGSAYAATQPMHLEQLIQDNQALIHPGFLKNRLRQTARQKAKAEVFTPTWICNIQNNLIDQAWFARDVVFNTTQADQRTTVSEKISFPSDTDKNWQAYVRELRLEVACGEAPYLVSRYDTVSGEVIPIQDRIGLLDRKLRVVTENTTEQAEWLWWVVQAYQSIYGFELQGDNLLIARSNLLATFVEYMLEVWQREPSASELEQIAHIISWNLWQMDGLTCATPAARILEAQEMAQVPASATTSHSLPCQIMDWKQGKTVFFKDLSD